LFSGNKRNSKIERKEYNDNDRPNAVSLRKSSLVLRVPHTKRIFSLSKITPQYITVEPINHVHRMQ
jgi:hypothetical protein